jgi:heme exporter protein D
MSEFFAMGGHGFYVWGSYGLTALFMIVEVILVARSKKTVLQRLSRMVRAERRNEQEGA